MNDTWVTLQGWVGADVECREAGGVPVASFRLGATPRYFKNGAWVDGTTSWYTVNTWRTLARNTADSVHKGDPVVVHGRMRADVWEREDKPPSVTHVIEATFVGHDLNRGVSGFQRAVRRDRADSGDPQPEPAPTADQSTRQTAAPSEGVPGRAVPAQRTSPEAAA